MPIRRAPKLHRTWNGRVEICRASERRAQLGNHWKLLRGEASHRNGGNTAVCGVVVNEAAHVCAG